jgi:hypothetical protein
MCNKTIGEEDEHLKSHKQGKEVGDSMAFTVLPLQKQSYLIWP